MEEVSQFTMNDLMWVFGFLIFGIIIMRWGIRKSVKRPKGGRMFKRKLED